MDSHKDSMYSYDTPSQEMPKQRNYPAYDAHGNPVAPCDVDIDEYKKCNKCKHEHVIEAFMIDFSTCVYCMQGPLMNRADAKEVRVSLTLLHID